MSRVIRNKRALIAIVLLAALHSGSHAQRYQAERQQIDWIFLIDTSRTMRGQGKAQGKNIFADVKQSIYNFLSTQVKTGDAVQLIPFDADARPIPSMTISGAADKEYVQKAIEDLKANGNYTYIGDAVETARNILEEHRRAARSGRKQVVIIFTDGIDEPPPSATNRIDLRQALEGYPKTDALFYFVNLGAANATNDLYQAMRADSQLVDNIESSPNGENIAGAVASITRKAQEAVPAAPRVTSIDLFWKLRQIDSPLPTDTEVEIRPVEISATGPGLAKVEVVAPKGITITQAKLFFDVGNKAVRPQFKVRASDAVNDSNVSIQLRLRPAGNTVVTRVTEPLVLGLQFHRPTMLERVLPRLIALIVLTVLAGLAIWTWRHWNTVPVDGLLYIQSARQGQARDPINLKTFDTPTLVVGGSGAHALSEIPDFQFELRSRGSGGRIRELTLVRKHGEVSVNGMEYVSRIYNEDEIEVPGYKLRYENFKLPQRQS
jgi:hypothetical protein